MSEETVKRRLRRALDNCEGLVVFYIRNGKTHPSLRQAENGRHSLNNPSLYDLSL